MRKIIAIILALAMVFTLCACGAKTETAAEAPVASDEQYVIKFGHFLATNHNEHLALEELKAMVEEKTDGRLIIEIYPASQLGSERELAEMVAMGTVDMSMSDGPTWSNALNIPELAVFGLPFLYNNIDGELEAFKNVVKDSAAEYMVPAGVRPLFAFSMSVRGTMTADSRHVYGDCCRYDCASANTLPCGYWCWCRSDCFWSVVLYLHSFGWTNPACGCLPIPVNGHCPGKIQGSGSLYDPGHIYSNLLYASDYFCPRSCLMASKSANVMPELQVPARSYNGP